jgi:hypothetical protein
MLIRTWASNHDVVPVFTGANRSVVWAVQSVIALLKVQTDQRFVQHESRLPGSNPAKLRDMSDAPTQVAAACAGRAREIGLT